MTRLLQDETQTSGSKGEERDLAGEATEMEAYRRRLRADISAEEAAEECAEIDARNGWMEGADLDDGEDLMGDPDEYDYDDELTNQQVADQDELFAVFEEKPNV